MPFRPSKETSVPAYEWFLTVLDFIFGLSLLTAVDILTISDLLPVSLTVFGASIVGAFALLRHGFFS